MMKFFHEKRMLKTDTLGLQDKKTRALYIKQKKADALALVKLEGEKGFLIKSDYELVTGIKFDETSWGDSKTKKYVSKYGMYQGVNPSKDRR